MPADQEYFLLFENWALPGTVRNWMRYFTMPIREANTLEDAEFVILLGASNLPFEVSEEWERMTEPGQQVAPIYRRKRP